MVAGVIRSGGGHNTTAQAAISTAIPTSTMANFQLRMAISDHGNQRCRGPNEVVERTGSATLLPFAEFDRHAPGEQQFARSSFEQHPFFVMFGKRFVPRVSIS
jgi:hypothetical protein